MGEQNDLMFAVPGGLIGVGTKVDPTLCRADRMVGQVLGAVGHLPNIYTELEISYYLLRRLLGVGTEGDKKAAKVQKLTKSEVLMVNIGSLSTGGRVIAVKLIWLKLVSQLLCALRSGRKLHCLGGLINIGGLLDGGRSEEASQSNQPRENKK